MNKTRNPQSDAETPSEQLLTGLGSAGAARAAEGLSSEDALYRLAAIVESSNDAIIGKTLEGVITSWNKGAERIYGFEAREAVGQHISIIIPPELEGELSRIMEGVKRGERIDHYETVRVSKDGQRLRISLTVSPIKDREGRVIGASAIARDITERVRSEKQFRQVIEGAPNGMVMVDGEGRITLVNAQVEKAFGYSRDELLGQPIEILVPERVRGRHVADRNSFISHPAARPMGAGRDLYGLRQDGSEFPVEIGLSPVETEQGIMVLGTIVDITERKRAEENLRRSQEQLASIISSAMDAIITVDSDQRIVLFNNSAERMFLFPAEDAIGQKLDRFIPERYRGSHHEHVEEFGRTRVSKRSMGHIGQLFGLRADGEEFPIETSISQTESDGQKLYTVIIRDVTERKRAEEALREQARMLDLAPVLVCDTSGRILFWNTGSELMYGWTEEEALGRTTHSLLRTEFPRPLEEIQARLYARGSWKGELIHTKRDGGRIVIASHWVLHRDENGKPKAVLEVNNDVTERKRAEEEVRRLNEELEQRVAERTAQLQAANKELEAFSYSVSHDLRAPLRHINGFSQILLEDYGETLDDDGKGYLQQVCAASQEMARLIDDVLQLARVTRSGMQHEQVDLSGLAREVVADLQKTEPERAVSVNIQDGLTTQGDKRLLKIMLVNLLGNAWKFTSKRELAEISFGQEEREGQTVYYIRDNGAGFDMTYADKLFGAFQRLHPGSEFEGTGIGLATVQRVTNRHGGHVWAQAAVDEGATFYFTLPRYTGSRAQSGPGDEGQKEGEIAGTGG